MPTDRNEFDARTYIRLAGFDGDWRDCWWNQDYLELLARRIGLPRRRRLLDVGCGVGHWGQRLLPLAAPGARLTGVDREPAFLQTAQERALQRGLADRCSWQHAAAETLPFPDRHFDLVTCQTVLMHVEHAGTALAEMVRVLAPGGVVLVAEPDNLVNALSPDRGPTPLSLEETLALAELQQVCAAGKVQLGHGDECVGSKLFGLFHQVGLAQVQSWTNDRAAALAPPYRDACQRRDLQILRGAADLRERAEMESTVESRARRHWTAGGGAPERFGPLWAVRRRWVERNRRAATEGSFVRGGGFLMFVCAGTKPS